MSDGTTDSLPTDPSLLRRMGGEDNSEAWSEFARRYRRFIRGLAGRHGLSEQDAQDLEQVVLTGLVQGIVGFKPRARRGSFRRWLSQRVRWRIGDMLRASRSAREEPLPGADGDAAMHPELLEEEADFAGILDRDDRVALVRRALNTLPGRMSPRNIQAFEMVVLHERTAEEASRMLQMSRAAVHLACHRVEKALRRRITELLASSPEDHP